MIIAKKWVDLGCILLAMAACSSSYACEAPVGKFCVDYFKGSNLEGKPVATQKTPKVSYNWRNRSPAAKVPYDNFSARWRGQFVFKEGTYEFRTLADDGVRVLLDGHAIMEHWQDGAGNEFRAQITPGAGQHLVEVEYFEAKGKARIQVDWKPVTVAAASMTQTQTQTQTAARNAIASTDSLTQLRQSNKAPIGVNLSTFSYYSSTIPFKDLLLQSGEVKVLKQNSNELCAEQPTLSQEDFPSSLPNGCFIRIWSAFHIREDDFWPAGVAPYQPGRYVLLYQGQGKIHLSWDAKNVVYKDSGRIEFDVPTPKDGIQIEITAMDWNDPIRELHLVHSKDEASFKDQPFNETWLALLKPFRVLRFMDWGAVSLSQSVYYSAAVAHTSQTITLPVSAPATNNTFTNKVAMINVDAKWPRVFIDGYDGATRTLHLKTPIDVSASGKQPTVNIYDFANRTWAERARPSTFGQSGAKGVAFETMIKLANTLGVDPWINVPTAADDRYVEALATLIKNQLNPALKCYIEYSNETWNFGFPGYQYAEAKARELNLSGTSIQADAWHAYRATEVFKIFNKVFGEADLKAARKQSRLVRVLTSQTAWLDRSKALMDWRMPGNAWPTNGNSAYQFADAWALTTYFYLDKDKSLELLNTEALLAAQNANIDTLFGTPSSPGVVRSLLQEANRRGLQLVAYEGGTHVLAPQDNPALIAKLAALNNNPGMKAVYANLLQNWDGLYAEFGPNAVGVLNHYSDISRYGKYGYWGLLQSTYQNPVTSPRYQAIVEQVSAP